MKRIKDHIDHIRRHWRLREADGRGGLDILRYIGPGLLVTVGFIDPGNWASNFAAGSAFGYALLWVVTLSTVMLIVLQHNVAHLGIATGLCLAEATTRYLPRRVGRPVLLTAMAASVSTSLAEILGAAIALEMLFGLPLVAGAALTVIVTGILLFTNSYRRVEKGIIAGVKTIAPTEWNFASGSCAEQALSMIEFSSEDQWRRDAAWILTAIDPCVPYSIRFHNVLQNESNHA